MAGDINGIKLEPAYSEKISLVKPWYRRWWVIAIIAVVVVWFGLPLVFKPLALKYEQKQLLNLTNNNDSIPPARAILETTDDPSKGYADAPVVIVEFLCYQCPFSQQAYSILKKISSNYPDTVKLIIKDFPIESIHPEGVGAAVAANCADEQGKFWEYHDALYENQDKLGDVLYIQIANQLKMDLNKFGLCQKSLAVREEIIKDYDDGIKAGVLGTPTFFVNGKKVEGALPYDLWQKIINIALAQKFE